MHTIVEVTWLQQSDTLALPHWKTLAECINSYLRAVAPELPVSWQLYDLDADVQIIALQTLVGELCIPAGTRLLISAFKEQAPISVPQTPPVASTKSPITLMCAIEIPVGTMINIPPQGLTLHRDWLAQRLSGRTKMYVFLQRFLHKHPGLRAISRQNHCEILLDQQLQAWIIQINKPLWIKGRKYVEGEHVHLASGATPIRFGSRGIELHVHVRVEL